MACQIGFFYQMFFKHVEIFEVLITLEQFSSGKFRHFTNKRIFSQIWHCISKRIFSQKSYYCLIFQVIFKLSYNSFWLKILLFVQCHFWLKILLFLQCHFSLKILLFLQCHIYLNCSSVISQFLPVFCQLLPVLESIDVLWL